MIAGNDDRCFVVFWIVAGDPPVNRLFDDGNLVLIWAGNSWGLAPAFNAHRSILDIIVKVKVSHVHLPDVKRARSIAPFSTDRPVAKVVNFDFSIFEHNRFLIDKTEKKIHWVEMFMIEDVLLLKIILSQDDLFCSKKCSVLVVEILFLLVAGAIMGYP